jgi:hypothetical protein
MKKYEPIALYTTRVMMARQELVEAGLTMTDSAMLNVMLKGLPKAYEVQKQILADLLTEDSIGVHKIIIKFTLAESQLAPHRNEDDSVHCGQTSGYSASRGGGYGGDSHGGCYGGYERLLCTARLWRRLPWLLRIGSQPQLWRWCARSNCTPLQLRAPAHADDQLALGTADVRAPRR